MAERPGGFFFAAREGSWDAGWKTQLKRVNYGWKTQLNGPKSGWKTQLKQPKIGWNPVKQQVKALIANMASFEETNLKVLMPGLIPALD